MRNDFKPRFKYYDGSGLFYQNIGLSISMSNELKIENFTNKSHLSELHLERKADLSTCFKKHFET
jgi:hypothetical protein